MSDNNLSCANQEMLRVLLAEHNVSQVRAAGLIAEQTARPCSPRTIRAWLADAKLPSARVCPEWAIRALRSALGIEATVS